MTIYTLGIGNHYAMVYPPPTDLFTTLICFVLISPLSQCLFLDHLHPRQWHAPFTQLQLVFVSSSVLSSPPISHDASFFSHSPTGTGVDTCTLDSGSITSHLPSPSLPSPPPYLCRHRRDFLPYTAAEQGAPSCPPHPEGQGRGHLHLRQLRERVHPPSYPLLLLPAPPPS